MSTILPPQNGTPRKKKGMEEAGSWNAKVKKMVTPEGSDEALYNILQAVNITNDTVTRHLLQLDNHEGRIKAVETRQEAFPDLKKRKSI